MKNRFDLEDEIAKLYSFVDNIDTAVEYLADSDVDPQVIDKMANMLLGTSTMLGLHADKMFDTMCQCFKIDKYRPTYNTDCNIKKCCKQWDTSEMNPIHDMSYDPNK